MSSSQQIYRVKSKPAGEGQASNESSKPGQYLAKWSMVIEEAKAFFSRLSGSAPTPAQPLKVAGTAIDETPGSFIAKESFKRGNDLVFFGDELYKWRNEFNIRPAFIALRNIESGEEVVSYPSDLERSDLMIHWSRHAVAKSTVTPE